MPVMLAWAIDDISVQNVRDYAALYQHRAPTRIGGDIPE
jgi:hypothetical protein